MPWYVSRGSHRAWLAPPRAEEHCDRYSSAARWPATERPADAGANVLAGADEALSFRSAQHPQPRGEADHEESFTLDLASDAADEDAAVGADQGGRAAQAIDGVR